MSGRNKRLDGSHKTKQQRLRPKFKVISGGQTGADVAGLIAARSLNIPTGGTAPEGYKVARSDVSQFFLTSRKTEAGPNLELARKYGLEARGGYAKRTRINVDDSDGTVCLIVHKGRGGTAKTVGYCHRKRWGFDEFESCSDGYRPVLVVEHLVDVAATAKTIHQWILEHDIRCLNVAGHCQSTAFDRKFTGCDPPFDYQKRCAEILKLALAPFSPFASKQASKGAAVAPVVDEKSTPICKFFNSKGGCKFGQKCKFAHPPIDSRRLVVHCRKAPFDVYIGRKNPSVKGGNNPEWGNPFRIGQNGMDRDQVCEKYEEWLNAQPELVAKAKKELKGKVLACWCAPQRCHGDTLSKVANSEDESETT